MSKRQQLPFQLSLPLALIVVLLAVLWIAGGASRADAGGQVVVRAASAVILVVALLFGSVSSLRTIAPIGWSFLAIAALVAVQLIPVPASLWQGLPERSELMAVATSAWRPLAIAPSVAWNVLYSLIVVAAALVAMAGLSRRDRSLLPGILLVLVILSSLIGLLQFSGEPFDNPLLNDTPGVVSGSFANRNHFALFIAIGCLLSPVWAFREGRRPGWRAPTAMGLVLVFVLVTLATGSRAGIGLVALAILFGALIVIREIRSEMRRYPRWVQQAAIASTVVVLVAGLALSILSDRAVSVDRVLAMDTAADMRVRGLPVVLAMIGKYLPWGSGLGGFDAVFRMHEPFGLLKPTYFNHAHNDWLEVVLDAGVAGLLALGATVGWWGLASVKAWRGRGEGMTLAKLGSSILLLVMLASVADYPARTPMIMTVIVIAAVWLYGGGKDDAYIPALPSDSPRL